MNRRRRIIFVFGVGALAAPLASVAQQEGKVWRMGFLGVTTASAYVSELEAIRERLRDLGYVEGKNIVIEYRWAEGSPERLREMAAALVSLRVDVIVTHSTVGARAAGQATKTIPIVMADSADPVAAGLVASYARPGGNITGSTSFPTELNAKRLELLKEILPSLTRVAILLNAQSPITALIFREAEIAAQRMKVELHQFAIKEIEELPGTFAAMAKRRVQGILIGDDPLFNSNGGAIAALAATHGIAAIGITSYPGAGGLLGYSSNRRLVYGRAASFVDRIFKGAKPGDLPIERASKFDFIVNLKTAKSLGIQIPQNLRLRADRVIE